MSRIGHQDASEPMARFIAQGTTPLPEPPHTVSVAAHVRAAIQHLKDAEIVLQIERERLENLIK